MNDVFIFDHDGTEHIICPICGCEQDEDGVSFCSEGYAFIDCCGGCGTTICVYHDQECATYNTWEL